MSQEQSTRPDPGDYRTPYTISDLRKPDFLLRRYNISVRTLYNWEMQGRIPPAIRIGRRKLWRMSDLLVAESKQ